MPASIVPGVRQPSEEEDAGALVAGTHVRSSKLDGCSSVSPLREFTEDTREDFRCPRNILPEDPLGLTLLDDSAKLKEKFGLRSVKTSLVPCDAEVLARCSANDCVHQTSKPSSREGISVRVHRTRSHTALFHARCQDSAGEGFDLHSSDAASSSNRSLEPEIQAPSTCADGNVIERGRVIIHAASRNWA